MKDLISVLAPYLCECKDTVEAKRVEMSLIWGIEPQHQPVIIDMAYDAKRGQYTAYGLICAVHDWLKMHMYF